MKHLGKLQAAVVLLVIIGFFLTLSALIFAIKSDVPSGMKDVLLLMVGALAAKFGDAVQFVLKARTDELLASSVQPKQY